MSDRAKIEQILRQVEDWPAAERAALAEALRNLDNGSPARKPRIEDLVGIAKGTGPAPTDDSRER